MINPETLSMFAVELTKLSAFDSELHKLAAPAPAQAAKMSGKMKTLLGLTAAGGIGAGAMGEQAKDDLLQGRRQRHGQARAMGMNRLVGLRT